MTARVLHDHDHGCPFGTVMARCPDCGCCVHCDEACVHECWVTALPDGTRCPTASCGCEGGRT